HRAAAGRGHPQHGHVAVADRTVCGHVAGVLGRDVPGAGSAAVRTGLEPAASLHRLPQAAGAAARPGCGMDGLAVVAGDLAAVRGGGRRRGAAPVCARGARSGLLGAAMNQVRAAFLETLRAVFSDRYAVVTLIGAVVLYSFFYPVA